MQTQQSDPIQSGLVLRFSHSPVKIFIIIACKEHVTFHRISPSNTQRRIIPDIYWDHNTQTPGSPGNMSKQVISYMNNFLKHIELSFHFKNLLWNGKVPSMFKVLHGTIDSDKEFGHFPHSIGSPFPQNFQRLKSYKHITEVTLMNWAVLSVIGLKGALNQMHYYYYYY